jgi:hypothetical protein
MTDREDGIWKKDWNTDIFSGTDTRASVYPAASGDSIHRCPFDRRPIRTGFSTVRGCVDCPAAGESLCVLSGNA